MSLPLWGELQKSQDDPQTILEAIAAAIVAHEEDPVSHLGEGESLQSHKNEDVIDHPAYSVVTDKVPDGGMSFRWFPIDRKLLISNMGEDNWNTFVSGGGGIERYIGELELRAGSTINDRTKASSDSGQFDQINWSHDWTWQSTVAMNDDQDTKVDFGFCNVELDASDFDGVFFRRDDGDTYVGMSESGGSETLHSITPWTVGSGVLHVFRMQYIFDLDTLYFYIDGVLAYTWASPSSDANTTSIGGFQIRSLSSATHSMYIYDYFIDVARPGT